ncbi:hypothetical protein RB195_014587 [Necator americanus]|uniref:Uncharacterized protein n=1 Tax=Necator americanus TaxID=51031 RepID=A0ABR1E0S4_NECAM
MNTLLKRLNVDILCSHRTVTKQWMYIYGRKCLVCLSGNLRAMDDMYLILTEMEVVFLHILGNDQIVYGLRIA